MPGILPRSSITLKGPFWVLQLMISLAVAGPMPLTATSCSSVDLFSDGFWFTVLV